MTQKVKELKSDEKRLKTLFKSKNLIKNLHTP